MVHNTCCLFPIRRVKNMVRWQAAVPWRPSPTYPPGMGLAIHRLVGNTWILMAPAVRQHNLQKTHMFARGAKRRVCITQRLPFLDLRCFISLCFTLLCVALHCMMLFCFALHFSLVYITLLRFALPCLALCGYCLPPAGIACHQLVCIQADDFCNSMWI